MACVILNQGETLSQWGKAGQRILSTVRNGGKLSSREGYHNGIIP